MSTIQCVRGYEFLGSGVIPTVAAEVVLTEGALAFAASPSRASTGPREALELGDGHPYRCFGKVVRKAAEQVNARLKSLRLPSIIQTESVPFLHENDARFDPSMARERDGKGSAAADPFDSVDRRKAAAASARRAGRPGAARETRLPVFASQGGLVSGIEPRSHQSLRQALGDDA